MQLNYKHTEYSCYLTYIVGAVINNFAALLFVAFSRSFGITLYQISYIIVLNFFTQICIDCVSVKCIDKIGYRKAMLIAVAFAFFGLVFLATLPFVIKPYIGILISVFTYAIGSGLLEVTVNPIVEALPKENNSKHKLSLLHSFYCWGCVIVVLLSTLFFKAFNVENWRFLCYCWAILPFICFLLFLKVPIVQFKKKEEGGNGGSLFKNRAIWIFALAMVSAGAGEIAMSQWASLFAETGLKVSKTVGDLLGPCFFAIMMGTARTIYGLFGNRLKIIPSLVASCIIMIIGYLLASLSINPIIALCGCGICGFGVALTWPGIIGIASERFVNNGSAIFAFLAMCGDIGCTIGPYSVAAVSSHFMLMDSEIKAGILFASIFPIIMLFSVLWMNKLKERK